MSANQSDAQRQLSAEDELPEEIVLALESVYDPRDGAFRTGAVCGAIGYGIVYLIFEFLPDVWLTWSLQGSWRLFISPTVTFAAWAFIGSLLGGLLLWALSATLASSRSAVRGAVWGMVTGYAVGALVGTGYVVLRTVILGGQTMEFVWTAHGAAVAGSSITLGSIFAVIGSLIGSIVAQPRAVARSKDACSQGEAQASAENNVTKARFQIGITRMLVLTAAIAVVIAIPAHIFSRLMRVGQLVSYSIVFEILIVLTVVLVVMLVMWPVMRGPTIHSRLIDSLVSWRALKSNREQLERIASQKGGKQIGADR
jgi:hypothetical protein